MILFYFLYAYAFIYHITCKSHFWASSEPVLPCQKSYSFLLYLFCVKTLQHLAGIKTDRTKFENSDGKRDQQKKVNYLQS